MRTPEEMAWYEVEGDDGFPRACHGVKRLMPEGSKEISQAQADEISAAVRAREPRVMSAAAESGVNVDLQPLQDQIDALAQALVGHARTLDQHEAEVKAVSQSVAEYLVGQKNLDGGGA